MHGIGGAKFSGLHDDGEERGDETEEKEGIAQAGAIEHRGFDFKHRGTEALG